MTGRRPALKTARRGVEIYAHKIRAQIEVDRDGECVAIDSPDGPTLTFITQAGRLPVRGRTTVWLDKPECGHGWDLVSDPRSHFF